MLNAAYRLALCLLFLSGISRAQTVVRVDSTPTAAWPGALDNLQDALSSATPGSQIWLAEGVYFPDVGTGQTNNSRLSTFEIPAGVELYGGFLGSESSLAGRAGAASNTVLSGDLLGNDVAGASSSIVDNAFHVVTLTGPGLASILDQLTVTGGNSDASAQNPVVAKAGGGVLVMNGASMSMSECFIESNHGFAGGGIHIDSGGAVELIGCLVRDNEVGDDGAGVMVTTSSSPVFVGCQFINNRAQVNPNNLNSDGGGVFAGGGSFLSCLFYLNDAKRGGGAYVGAGCTFESCTFFGNSATFEAGGIYTFGTQEIANTIIWNNVDQSGMTQAAQLTMHGGVLAFSPSYCCIQGLDGTLGGVGNIDVAPQVVQASTLDFHLLPSSPCINAGDPAFSRPPAEDLEGEPRVLQCRTDIGCDESPYFEDLNMNGLSDSCEGTGLGNSRCLGNGGDQMGCTNCPCMNNSPIGTLGGCLNSVATSARLVASGDASVTLPPNDLTDLRFSLVGAPPLAFCILNSGDAVAPNNPMNPCFGLSTGVQATQFDGLRCAVMNTRRHGGRSANGNGDVGANGAGSPWGGEGGPPVGIAVAGAGFVSGQTRYFQVINRDDPLLVCMRGLNTSQAVEVIFTP